MRAIVLGSGLSGFSKYFENIKSEAFESVMDIPFETLDGHDRKFIWCRIGLEEFVIISGKFHYYEGHSYPQLISPLKYAVEELGVDQIIVTSASGGLSNRVIVGQWAYINQIVCIPEMNINIGSSLSGGKSQKKTAPFDSLPRTTYAYHQGPSLGSLAEYKMLNKLNADLVGMSMLPEYCYLKTLDVASHFLSIPVCNYFPFEELVEPSYEEVLKVSSASIPDLVHIFKSYLTHQRVK